MPKILTSKGSLLMTKLSISTGKQKTINMKILVTGGMGFMGSNFVHYMIKKYPRVKIINLDKLTYAANLDNLSDIKTKRYKFIKGDICDQKLVRRIAKKADIIVNYAAESHVDRSIIKPDTFIKTDILGTYMLLEAAREAGTKRYIQIGTDEVYGSKDKGVFKETSPFSPNSPYSASKAGADHLVRAYYVTYGLSVIRTNSCNFYGPYQYPEKIIPLFITNLIEGKKVPVYGDGNQVREWIFAEDHCKAVDLILQKGKVGESYNIGTGERKKNIELTRILLKNLRMGEEMIEHVKDRAGHDVRYALDSTKIKRELGFKPKYKFVEGIKKTIAWYKNNQEWWRKIKSGNFRQYYQKQYLKR
jgi:dTDP-glucose 4,6-dehydratase